MSRYKRKVSKKGWKPQWNYSDFPSDKTVLKPHASGMEISSWSCKYFDKSFSINIIGHCIHKGKLRLFYAQQKWYVTYVQKHCWPLLTWAQFKWSHAKWKYVVLRVKLLVFGNNERCVLWVKEEKDWLLSARSSKARVCHAMGGGVLAANWHICVKKKIGRAHVWTPVTAH